jgi:hypothetical protein
MIRLTLSLSAALVLMAGCGATSAPPQRHAYGDLPLTFIENRGQTDSRVVFHVQGPGQGIYLTKDAIALTLSKPSGKGVALNLRFLGANPNPALSGAARAPGEANFLTGNDPKRWRTHVPGYEGVTYRQLWPGIDLELSGKANALKYEFHVHPGASVSDIRMAYRGARGLRLRGGALEIETGLGGLTDSAPIAYQGDTRIDSRYTLNGSTYGFATGAYDKTRDLVIDPSLSYSTFLGGASHEMGESIAADAQGNAYVTGFTQSPDFPTTAGAFDRTGAASNNLDVFVAKLNPAGTALVYSTFLGGGSFDWGRAIAVDSAGNAYVAGRTQSSTFPTTSNAFDRTFNVDTCPRCGIDQADAFVTKLNPSGSGLVYSTFIGGTQPDDAFGIALDASRNAYITGDTTGNFPTTAGAFQTAPGGGSDAWLAKLNATGSALNYATRLGGNDNDLPEGVAVDANGNATVGGSTRSTDWPTTPGAFDTTQNGGAFDQRFDLFVTKVNAAGNGLVYSTYVGGSNSDFGDDFAQDAAGNTYLVGGTLSADFPTTPGVLDTTFTGSEAFALKLNPTGSALVYSTFLGAGGGSSVVPDASGAVWLAGAASPGAAITADAFDPSFNGGVVDAYVAKLNATGSAIDFASYLGGSNSEAGDDIALDPAGNVYVTGHTYSSDFTTTPGAFDRTWAGDPNIFWGDAFVAKISGTGSTPPPTPTPTPTATTAPPTPTPTATATATTAPAQLSPAADARFSPGAAVTFDWSDVSGATGYTIQIDDSQSFSAPLTRTATVTASQYTATGLPTTRMWWRVRANDGTWSSARRFELKN